jgi:hypothetical protein
VFFQGLPKHFQSPAVEFGKLIEEQHSVVVIYRVQ